MNPFWKSKKFAYAISMLIAVIVLALLPAVCAEIGLTLTAESQEALNEIVPGVVILFGMVIGGHTLQDALTTAKGAQIVDLKQAILDVLDAIPLSELVREITVTVGGDGGDTGAKIEAVPPAEQR